MMRVALVHDWLTAMRGGERCLEALLDLYPEAEIFTLLHVPGSVSPRIEERPIHSSFIARLPRAADLYRYYLPLFPAAVERLDVRGFDLVVSISHCVAKGVRLPEDTPHLCYCLTPMRYLWDLYGSYFGPERASPWVRAAMPLLTPRLRRWDRASAGRPDALAACSSFIAERIRRCYGREAAVVYPPVSLERFRPAPVRDDFYLVVSALVPYKRVDLVVEAFNRLDRRLVIVGTGPELPRLRAAAGPNVSFAGRVGDAEVADWLGRCRAFVFSAEDDFGITAVEAQAAGAPVIAYGRGGATETVVDGATGVLFPEQTPESLIAAIHRFEAGEFEPSALQASALRFGVEAFHDRIRLQAERLLSGIGRLPAALPPARAEPPGGALASPSAPASEVTMHPARIVRAGVRQALPGIIGLLLSATAAPAQSLLERPPSLGGTWVGESGTLHFHFLHRFEASPAPARKVVNTPTFLVAASLPANLLAGARYATSSLVAPGFPNEWEFFARARPLAQGAGSPGDVAVQLGYNQAAQSVDGELALARTIGPVRLLAAGRAFSDGYGAGESRFALAGGTNVRLTEVLSLAADVASLLDTNEGEDVAWSAGLHLRIPTTPHTLSLHASNVNTTTLQGASVGAIGTRWGFEFTVPLTLSRYFGGRASEPVTPAEVTAGDATVTMTNQLTFTPASIRVKAGQVVTWRNTSDVVHTVTADPARASRPSSVALPSGAQPFDSGDLAPGAVFRHTFTVPGTYRYFCVPHEMAGMVGTVIVES